MHTPDLPAETEAGLSPESDPLQRLGQRLTLPSETQRMWTESELPGRFGGVHPGKTEAHR